MDLGVVGLDRLGDLLHDRGLARFRRGHDEASLTLADGRDQVHDPRRHVGRVTGHLERETLIGEQRGEVLEAGALLGLFGIDPVDGLDAEQGRVLLVPSGRAGGAGEAVTLAQRELPRLLDRDVDVVLAGKVALEAQEAVALVTEVEEALHLNRFALERLLLIRAVSPLAVTTAATTASVARLAVDSLLGALDRFAFLGLRVALGRLAATLVLGRALSVAVPVAGRAIT